MRALVPAMLAGAVMAAATSAATAAGAWTLTARSPAGAYAPTFTGNGLLGIRVPPSGQGYLAGTVPTDAELAGFYAQPAGGVQQRANLPVWSDLRVGSPNSLGAYPSSEMSRWHQSIDLRTGLITTSFRLNDGGSISDLTYRVLADRARPNLGLVQLEMTPHWSGLARVTDAIDGTPATLTTPVAGTSAPRNGRDTLTIRTVGTNLTASLASELTKSANVTPYTGPLPLARLALPPQSVGQTVNFTAAAGQTYTFTKYVGIVDSQQSATPAPAAQAEAGRAAVTGWNALVRENDAAWKALWSSRIDVLGSATLATDVNASQFYLWASTRAGSDWSISPAGLSSNDYDGHIFWDAETWMFPSLLALHPELAAGMDAYRGERLAAARAHALSYAGQHYKGARFPWESALDGTEQIPPPVSTNSEGLYEQHITADVALAQWQYYLASGDRHWLATRGWPVIDGAATFWASRVSRGRAGAEHITGVTGPDEENPDVSDDAYTNAAAATTLKLAAQAAHVLHKSTPASWSTIAAQLGVPVRSGLHPEFSGYRAQLVKQADVTLLQYPWAWPMSAKVAQADLGFYVPRTDPTGPSMSDAVGEIDTSALGTPGCSAYVYTERSYQPFIKDPFDQFSETRKGGAFTFMTGIGGFLQEFLYGYSGLHLTTAGVRLDPSLTAQLPGLVLRGLRWHGRSFTVAIAPRRTTVSLQSGAPLPLAWPGASGCSGADGTSPSPRGGPIA